MQPHFIPTLAISFNEDVIFFLVFAVFGLIKFLSARKEASKETDTAPSETDAEQARRRRAIQEEIRRRIAENMKTAPSAPAEVAPAAQKPAPQALRPDVFHQDPVARPVKPRQPAKTRMTEEFVATSENILQQLAEAERLEAETRRKAAAMRAEIRLAAEEAPQSSIYRSGVEHLLRRPSGLRDAVLVSEILSAPLSEREGGSCPGVR